MLRFKNKNKVFFIYNETWRFILAKYSDRFSINWVNYKYLKEAKENSDYFERTKMQKVLYRPICHMNFEEANLTFDELRASQHFYQPQQGSVIQRGVDKSPFGNSRVGSNNNQMLANSRSQ